MNALEYYFSTLLGSKEFSNLPSLRKWVEDTFKKNYKGPTQDNKTDKFDKNDKNSVVNKVPRKDSNSGMNTNAAAAQSFIRNSDHIQRYREIVERYSKCFIDLNGDNNQHLEAEDGQTREKNYKNLLKTKNVFDHEQSRFFKIVPGDNKHFECLGLEEPRILPVESQMLSKLSTISKKINVDLAEEYSIEELILKIKLDRS